MRTLKIRRYKLEKLIRNGEIIITTKKLLKEAVKENISHLYNDTSDFVNNTYMTDREFERLSATNCDDIANDVLDYLLND